jgi:hypothetical protein
LAEPTVTLEADPYKKSGPGRPTKRQRINESAIDNDAGIPEFSPAGNVYDNIESLKSVITGTAAKLRESYERERKSAGNIIEQNNQLKYAHQKETKRYKNKFFREVKKRAGME